MPFIIGHGLAGTFLYGLKCKKLKLENWKLLCFYVFCAICPDLDIIPGILFGETNKFHHGVSHSFLGAVVISTFLYIFFHFWKKSSSWKDFLFILLLVFSNALIDIFSIDTSFDYGCPLLYPFGGYIISPWVFFQDIHRAGLRQILSLHNALAIGIEIGVFLPPVLALHATQKLKGHRRISKKILLWVFALGLSLFVIMLSLHQTVIKGKEIFFT